MPNYVFSAPDKRARKFSGEKGNSLSDNMDTFQSVNLKRARFNTSRVRERAHGPQDEVILAKMLHYLDNTLFGDLLSFRELEEFTETSNYRDATPATARTCANGQQHLF